jgi:hypothetical protein
MNNRQLKIELLFAANEVIQQSIDKTPNREHIVPLKEFISIIKDAIDQSLIFYERHIEKNSDCGEPRSRSLKVTFEPNGLSVKYVVNFSSIFSIMDGSSFVDMMGGGINFDVFFDVLNELSEDVFQTTYSVQDMFMDGIIECETVFNIDHLLDHVKKMPQPHKLF